ncbi:MULTISPECIES: MmgE/PrpD family protein [Burkholderiaceae]|uniref:hypothetical protein n=1 Tax=Burkholderiaceae TaxID=119060 RepID=UPI00336A8083
MANSKAHRDFRAISARRFNQSARRPCGVFGAAAATGKKTPQIGLEGKFSIYHAVAIAVIDGAAGEKQFSDAKVRDPMTVALRQKVNTIVDQAIKPEQVDMTITLKDGRKLHKFIQHAIGSTEVPMTDQQLEKKFSDLAEGILSPDRTRKLIDTCWHVEQLDSAGESPCPRCHSS